MRLGLSLSLGGVRGGSGTPAVPVAPSAFTAGQWSVTPTNTAINVTINSLPYNGGSAITAVQYRLNGGSWVSSGGTVSFTISGLTNGTTYTIELRAVNAIGNGLDSDDKTATPATVPSAPTLVLTPADGQVTIAWTDGATGGSAITARRLYRSTSSGFTPDAGTLIATSPTFPYVDTAVTNDTAYYYKGIAANAIGDSAASTQQSATPSATVAQVEIISNDTLSRFEVANAASFPGATYAWKDETGATISGQTGATMLWSVSPSLAVQAIANGNPATASNFAIASPPTFTTVLDTDFTGITANTDLVGWNSFTGNTGKLKFNVSGANRLDIVADSYGQQFPKVLTGDAYRIKSQLWHSTIPVTSGNPEHFARQIIFNRTDTSNFAMIEFERSGVKLTKVAGGTGNSIYLRQGADVLATNGGVARLEITKQDAKIWVKVFYAQNGVDEVLCGPDGLGTDINAMAGSALTWTPTMALRGGYLDTNLNPAYPFPMYKSLYIGTKASVSSVNIVTATPHAPELGVDPYYSIVGNYTTAAAANFEAVLIGSDGKLLGTPTTFTSASDGSFNAYKHYFSLAHKGKQAKLRIRLKSTPSNYTDYDVGIIPPYAEIEPLVFGINLGGSPAYSPSDVVKDRGYVISWRYRGPSGLMYIPDSHKNAEGWPINVPMPAGYDSERIAILFEGAPPGTRYGTWSITANVATPGGMIVSDIVNFNTPTNRTTTSIKITTTDPTANQQAWVQWPASVVPPAGGLQVSCLLDGETVDTNSVTAKLAEIWSNTVFNSDWISVRTMVPNRPADPEGGTPNQIVIPFVGRKEWAADATKRLGAHIHCCWPWASIADRIETDVRPYLEHFRDNAKPGSELAGTDGNEIWNDQFWVEGQYHTVRGFTEQLVPSVGVPVGKTVTNEERSDYNPTGAVMSNGLTMRTINPGEWFYCTGAGGQNLVECIASSAVAAGATIPATSNSSFAIRANYNTCYLARRRYQGFLHKKLRPLGREVLGDRFISTYEHFLGDSPQYLADLLLYDNTWEGVDEYSPSFYAGAAVDYGTLTWHSKHTSDFAAFKAGYIARWQTTWAATLATLITLKHEVPKILLAAGVPVDRLPKLGRLYEGGDHNTIKSVPSDQQAGLRAALIEVFKSAEGFAMVAQIWSDLEKYIGGTCEWFVDVERTFYNGGIYPSGQMQSFGLREYQFNGSWNANGANEGRYNATVAAFA